MRRGGGGQADPWPQGKQGEAIRRFGAWGWCLDFGVMDFKQEMNTTGLHFQKAISDNFMNNSFYGGKRQHSGGHCLCGREREWQLQRHRCWYHRERTDSGEAVDGESAGRAHGSMWEERK